MVHHMMVHHQVGGHEMRVVQACTGPLRTSLRTPKLRASRTTSVAALPPKAMAPAAVPLSPPWIEGKLSDSIPSRRLVRIIESLHSWKCLQ